MFSSDQPVDFLLLAPPAAVTRVRLQGEFDATGVTFYDDPLGLKIPCQGIRWQTVLENVLSILSGPERRETRVAVIHVGAAAIDIQRAIFHAKGLEQLVQQIHEGWLYDVLQEDAIQIHLQPIMEYPPGRVHGYECLMRGVDRAGKLISPARMFSAARRLDMLFLLDQRSRVKAVKHAASLGLRDVQFFINFLPTAIYDPQHCLKNTIEQVRSSGMRPEQITFEVVETEEVEDLRHLASILRVYREQGFKIALDDVGAGYSSLLSLSELRPDYIKLDAELVRRAAHGALEQKMVRDLAETARQHGIITIAEGVETVEQFRSVVDMGIGITQGYLHARPQPSPLSREQSAMILNRMTSCTEDARIVA